VFGAGDSSLITRDLMTMCRPRHHLVSAVVSQSRSASGKVILKEGSCTVKREGNHQTQTRLGFTEKKIEDSM